MASTNAATKMSYRFLGNSGLLMMQTAFKNGVNLFDSAENYAFGPKIFSSTKGFNNGTPNSQCLNRKHLIEGTQASLRKMGLNYVDVICCHHPDAYTPTEETVRAMNYIVDQGWAFYWGTSNWSTSEITEAYVDLFKKYKLGITARSPLALGTLAGKYSSGCPEGSRMYTEDIHNALWGRKFDKRVQKADKLKRIGAEMGCSLAQLALAWRIANKNVSTVIVGASRQSQLEENLKALDLWIRLHLR
ncbi:Voltage-gated potassium channel subunit beta [Phytophthora palmivora]|uniref:Voltage-gated potassium channel subunit beta n=1 Tax=Phytophthora palmivora TaxID=4796 RepID=A0A2P4Y1C1_9STRA|nr:Voltage-gated potassium channel subunit beta [Phytophthora palmivora]